MSERYITRRRARFNGIGGQVNIPYGTVLEVQDGFLMWQGKRLCAVTSQNAHDYFVSDHDGLGRERGALICAILTKLERRDTLYQARWDNLWDDLLARRYCQGGDHWLWRHTFYSAPLEDLRHIAGLVGAKA